jgi:membrane fusion protein (multidrug efflux system)
VADVGLETFRQTVNGIGTLRAAETVEITPEIEAILNEVHFKEGDTVEKGVLLFTLDDSKLRKELRERNAALDVAEARLEEDRKSFQRIKELYRDRAVSEARWDQARTGLEASRSEVRRLEAAVGLIGERLKDTRIRAPFKGILSERFFDPGDYVETGNILVRLYKMDVIETDTKIPDRYAGRIRVGQGANIRIDAYPDRIFSGAVSFVSPAVDERTRDFLVKLTLENREDLLKPGAFATVSLTLEVREERPAVPEEALVATREGYVVFVFEDGKARKRKVETGLRRPGMVEIVRGLNAGETIIRTGHMQLSDGDAVSVSAG